MPLPHDVTDLQLAPVALALDKELQTLGAWEGKELDEQVLISTNRGAGELTTRTGREKLLVQVVTAGLELHGWEVTCDERGLRMTHHDNTIVLGLSESLGRFLTVERG
jgi:hypothetical protein